ncbi:MAG TPA: GNAT family N-acetyltransferase, partial [Caldilineaceae bacterium]|nr:GNAT family N-acetyltransferase [Caldilineaceae bacterium]
MRAPHEPRPTAEPGILVEDRFQGQGIGRRLWRQLHDQARADRIAQLRVFLAPNNQPMLRLLQGSGFAYQARAHAGLSEYLVLLGEQAVDQPLASVAGLRAGHFSLPP